MDIFDLNKKDFEKLDTFLKRCPKLFPRATANVLTSLAFKTREYDIDEITQSMTVRNPAFLRSSLRVNKAKGGRIENQVAEVYSIKRDNFSGWEEQQKGGSVKKNIHKAARGGNIRSRVKQKYRLKSSNRFARPSDYPGRNIRSQFYAMLRIMATRKGGEFIITKDLPLKHGVLKPGLFTFTRHKIIRLQMFSESRVKNNKWRTRSTNRIKSDPRIIGDIWSKSLDHIVKQSGLSV